MDTLILDPERPPENQLSRRNFTRWLMGFSVTATLVGVLTPIVSFLLPPSGQSVIDPERTTVGTPADFLANTGKVVAVGSKPVIITNPQGGGLQAFSAICTHLGCVVHWNEAGYIQSPCHDGRFNAKTGDVISGPPPRPLPRYELSIDGEDVVVGRPLGSLCGES
jgi:cytochrome b6-f complex iron-sulfur subunit